MNVLGFIDLMRTIYGRKLPDIERIQSKGLLAIKIAQHYALRIDFLDERVCRHLARLYRHNLTLPAERIDELLARSVAPGWRERVRDVERTPLASASVGQVHRARLAGGGPVVVKVIKRDFKAAFLKDIASLRRMLRAAIWVYPKLRKVFDPTGILDHIEEYTLNELDLRNEIEGQRILRGIRDENAGRYDLERLRFHRLHEDLSGENVLVSEFVEGETFDDLLERGALPYERMLQLFDLHGFYVFGAGVFHGDIHPGNIMLEPDGRICLVDTSAISAIGTRVKNGLFRFFVALSAYDFDDCARRLNEMARKPIAGAGYERFRERFLVLYRDFAGKSVSDVSLTKKMMDTIKLGVHSGMEFERGMFSIIKSLMYLDGMVLRCKPAAVLMEDMRPFIGRLAALIEGPLAETQGPRWLGSGAGVAQSNGERSKG
ncbi:MAG: AarF/ABC1/UbiB kinase family protein [Vicinamibacteria bacterium]|nr:AarF/ABC1/UbiB kinase family protein [Vicinamibacteria bacterium]